MTNIEELIKDEPPEVQRALRAAFAVLETDSGPKPEDAIKTLAKIGLSAAKGSVPPAPAIIEGILALISLVRIAHQRRQIRIEKSRKLHTAAGLAARESSRQTSARARKLKK